MTGRPTNLLASDSNTTNSGAPTICATNSRLSCDAQTHGHADYICYSETLLKIDYHRYYALFLHTCS
jgi:hypothetical protein